KFAAALSSPRILAVLINSPLMVESFHSNFVANVNLQYPVPYCRALG
ncbi:MAG: hypothetical protein ACI8T1_005262, partial [Verrucomicrobiales bacterium]